MHYHKLFQPILVRTPEPGHSETDVYKLDKFLDLLRREEDYYPGEQHNTMLMITRLRKIFYDHWGWDTQLIRGASKIPGRYVVEIVDDDPLIKAPKHTLVTLRNKNHEIIHKRRVVTYSKDDKQYPERAGQIPEIYALDHQELLLPEGYLCDIAHVLAGIDAINYLAPVAPLPSGLMWLSFMVPTVDSNADIVTWTGDAASASGDFVFEYIQTKDLTEAEKQQIINVDSPGSDMLGDIDPYIISKLYNISSAQGLRVSDILYDYYSGDGFGRYYRERRFSFFCESVGLRGWDGEKFANEDKWMKYYIKQLRVASAFCIVSQESNVKGVLIALKTWLRLYEKQLDLHTVLCIFLDELKKIIKKEPEIAFGYNFNKKAS